MTKYLSDIISKKDIQKWINNNSKVGIHTGVGTGKTSLINNVIANTLIENNQRALSLSSRINITEQQENDSTDLVKSTKSIDYKTVQNIITKYVNTSKIPTNYDLVIIDEYHHIITDSGFNTTMFATLEILSKMDVPVIFISATPPRDIFELDVVITDEDLGQDRYTYEKVEVYHYQDELLSILDDIIENTNDKVLFYMNNGKKIKEIRNKYKDISMVVSSEDNILSSDLDKNKIEKLKLNKMFDDRILFTTKKIDSGIDIIDKNLKHIIAFSYDTEEVLQIVGRKRDNKNDLNVYLKNYTPKELGGIKSQITQSMNLIDIYEENPDDIVEMIINGKIENGGLFIFRNGKLEINKTKQEQLIREYKILDRISENGYVKELEKVGLNAKDMTFDREWSELENYLKENYNKNTTWYDKYDKKDIIETINFRENGVMRKSISKLNTFLEKRRSDYRIKKVNTTKNGKRYGNAWRLKLIN